MQSWLDLVGKSEFLAGLFGDRVPSLQCVEMHEIAVQRDGPSLRLRFDLQEFPTSAPAAWKAEGYNTLQLTIGMIGLQSVVLSGWATEVNGPLRIAADEDAGLRVHFDSASVSFGATASHAVLERVSPYVNKRQF